MELLSSLLHHVWAIFLIILFFGGSIFVHELGHFLAARRRGVKDPLLHWFRPGNLVAHRQGRG